MNIKIVSGSTRIGRNSHRVALALNNKITALGIESSIVDLNEINLPPFEERLSFLPEKPER